MAGTQVNTYTNEDTDIGAMQLTLDKVFHGLDMLTLTHMADTTVPAIAAGSVFEVNGALIKFDAEESITVGGVANGTVYIMVDGSALTAAFTATAPTWSDVKQGFYGTGGDANKRYVPVCMTKATAAYNNKRYIGYRNLKALDFDDIDLTCDDITCDDIACDTMAATTFTGTWSGGDANVTHLNVGSGTTIHGLNIVTQATGAVSYPSGFTNLNTVVLSIMIGNSSTGPWRNVTNYDYNPVKYELAADHIDITDIATDGFTHIKITLART